MLFRFLSFYIFSSSSHFHKAPINFFLVFCTVIYRETKQITSSLSSISLSNFNSVWRAEMSTKARKRAIGNHAKGRKNILNRELVFSSPGSEYAKVVESLGGNRLRVLCFSDNLVRLCNIRGTLRRREWVYKDVVLVSMRDYQDTVCDLLLKYNQDEVQKLIMYKEIPENVGAGDENDDEKGPCVIFGEMSEDD